MEKLNSQAETHSGPSGAPRTSSPKRELCCNFATAYFFLFLYRLQAQALPRPGFKHHAAEARATVIFLLTAQKILYITKMVRVSGAGSQAREITH